MPKDPQRWHTEQCQCGHDMLDMGTMVGETHGYGLIGLDWEPYWLCIRCDQADIGADVIEQFLKECAA